MSIFKANGTYLYLMPLPLWRPTPALGPLRWPISNPPWMWRGRGIDGDTPLHINRLSELHDGILSHKHSCRKIFFSQRHPGVRLGECRGDKYGPSFRMACRDWGYPD